MFDDAEALEKLKRDARRQLRERFRRLRAAFPSSALAERSQRIVERLVQLDAYRAATSVGLFWPLAAEVDLKPLDAHARAQHKRVFYPVMDPREGGAFRTGFAETRDPGELAERGRKFLEPPPEATRAARGEVELIVVPALAVTDGGHRLGYGVGFYDATLPDFCPPAHSLIVAYEFQLLAELPLFDHDFACDTVMTDGRTIRVPRRKSEA